MKTTFKTAFLKKYPKNGGVLSYMNKSLGKECGWKDLTRLNILDFCQYMEEQGVSKSSLRTYCAMIKSVLNTYAEEIKIPCRNYSEVLSVRGVKSSNTWLTDEELARLIKYSPSNALERQVRNQFIIGAYTGCRRSDFTKLDAANIVGGYIIYISQKTNIRAQVPIKPIVFEYLTEERVVPPSKKSTGESPVKNRSTPSSEKFYKCSDVTFNRTIRNICKKCGITDKVKLFQAGKEEAGEKWEFVSSHTARRSFATNLYLRGCDLFSISRMMGHALTEMTERYICCGLKEQDPKVLEYFK